MIQNKSMQSINQRASKSTYMTAQKMAPSKSKQCFGPKISNENQDKHVQIKPLGMTSAEPW